MAPKRTGRPPKYVTGRNGRPIAGLSRHKTTGRYYATFSKPREYFGTDFDSALVRFREWESRQKGERVLVKQPIPASVDPTDANEFGRWFLTQYPALDLASRTIDTAVLGDVFWSMVRKAITQDPALAAEKTGLPLDRLHRFKEPEPSLELRVLFDTFMKRPKEISRQSRSDYRRYWDTFVSCVGAKTIADLTPEAISRYAKTILRPYFDATKSHAWVQNQFIAVRQIVRWALKMGEDADNAQRALTLFQMLEIPQDEGEHNPQPISREHFQSWYSACDTKHKGILLTMLNAAMRQTDISRLRFFNPDGSRQVDLESGLIVTRRRKTGNVVRCCCLWDRTLRSIAEWREGKPPGEWVFENEMGSQSSALRIAEKLREYRDKAGLPKSVKIAHIRDGAYTACVAAGIDLVSVKILCGHKVGIPDAYVQRGPRMVEAACKAIEQAYFSAATK